MGATQVSEIQADALAVHAGMDQTQTGAFEGEALALREEAKAITVSDQASYDLAVDTGNRIAGAQKRWKEWIERPYQVVYGAYKTVLGVKKGIEDPLEEGKKHLAAGIQQYLYRQEQERLAAQWKLEEAQRKQEEERKLQAAAQAEQAGVSEESVQDILEAPSVAPKPVAAATYQKNMGASTRENWAGEVEDFAALVKAVAKNKNLLPLLQINQPALNAMARTHKANLANVVPGTRGVDKGAVSFRRAG